MGRFNRLCDFWGRCWCNHLLRLYHSCCIQWPLDRVRWQYLPILREL